MGKVKQELLTEVGCVRCDTLYPRWHAALGYRTCTDCGEVLSKQKPADARPQQEKQNEEK